MDQNKSSSNTRRALIVILFFCTHSSVVFFMLKHQQLIANKGEKILSSLFGNNDHQSLNPSEKSSTCEEKYYFGGPMFTRPVRKVTENYRQKAVCLDPKVSPEVSNCLIYSFGIQYDWYFEENMGDVGCQVYAFDPSMFIGKHDHSGNIHFYPIGLGSNNTAGSKNGSYDTMTLSSVYEMLSPLHEKNTIIDYLKINHLEDLAVLTQIIDSGFLKRVRQLSVAINVQKDQTENEDHLTKISKVLQRITDESDMVRFDYRGSFEEKRESSRKMTSYYSYEVAWFNAGKLDRA